MATYNPYFPQQGYTNPYMPSYYPQQQIPQQQIQQQPVMPQQGVQTPQQQQSSTGILWVASEAEAQAYPVAPNNAVALWDSSRPSVYLKQADASGKPVLKIYDLAERTQEAAVAASAAGERKDTTQPLKREIEALWAAVDEIKQKMETGKRPSRKREVIDDDAE